MKDRGSCFERGNPQRHSYGVPAAVRESAPVPLSLRLVRVVHRTAVQGRIVTVAARLRRRRGKGSDKSFGGEVVIEYFNEDCMEA